MNISFGSLKNYFSRWLVKLSMTLFKLNRHLRCAPSLFVLTIVLASLTACANATTWQNDTPFQPLDSSHVAIILINGINSGPTVWTALEGESGQEATLFNDQHVLQHANIFRFGYDKNEASNYSPYQLAISLKQEIDANILSRYPNAKIIFVCHSNGGLVARNYIEQLGGDSHLGNLITVGTPHHGTPVPDPTWLNGLVYILWLDFIDLFIPVDYPSLYWDGLYKDIPNTIPNNQLATLNVHLNSRPDIMQKYILIAGDISAGVNNSNQGWKSDVLSLIEPSLRSVDDNDGVVPVDSALLYGTSSLPFNGIFRAPIVNGLDHISLPNAFDGRSTIIWYVDLAVDALTATGGSGGGGGGGGGGAGESVGSNNAAYVADVTVPDKTTFSANQGFNKVWQIKNTGSTSWSSGYHWTFDGGDQMGGPNTIGVPSVGPGSTWNPSVNLQAPASPGTYKGYWRMQAPDGHKFGDRVWVLIQVSANGSDNAVYIADVTVPDNTSFVTNQSYTKTWRILNTGSTSWGNGYQWTFDGGDQMGGPNSISVPSVGPGSTWNPSVNLQAPASPGTYKGYWRMQAPDGHKFGDRVWVQIQVSQGGANVSTFVSESDTASGVNQPGFWKQGTPQYWHDATDAGDGGHMFWTYNNDNAHGTDDIGFWRPNLPNTQPYEVFVFIPHNHATTTQAHYSVYAADGQHDVNVNQLSYNDQWVSLGTYQFNSGTGNYLRLIDQTGESYASKEVGFDSAQWQPRTSIPPPTPTTAIVSESDTAPYDGAAGFFRHGTAAYWHNAAFGDGGHMYWTYNNDPAHGSDDIGDWRPTLATPGKYEVFAYIPNNYANTTQAHYTVNAPDGPHDVYVNQSVYFNQWVSLGTYRFNSGTSGFLRLVDQTNEKYASKWVGFDTAQWQPRAGNANAPSNLQPSGDAVVGSNVNFTWQDNGMDDGNPSVNFQIQVWHVVNGQRADQVWSSDWQAGTSRAWSAPGPAEYEWIVQAGNGINQSSASSPARFIVPAPVPATPSNLLANAISPVSIQLAWQDNSSIETGFKIERQGGGSGYTQIGTVGANVTNFVDTNLTPNIAYTYRVRATNVAGDSGYTNEATATTPADVPVVSLSLAPSLVPGGTSSTATIVLGGPALPGGSMVALSSSNAVATVPTMVMVPAGQSTATFTFGTQTVAVNTPLSITATNSVTSTSAALTVQAPTVSSMHLLWTNTSGAFSLWTIGSGGSYTSTPAYGPFSGWAAAAIADGSDGLTRVLLKHSPDGQAAVWTVTTTTGVYTSTPGYGPYGDWTGRALAVGADNQTRLLWKNGAGSSSVWTLDSSNNISSTPAYGPYGDWSAQALAVGSDSQTRLLWKNAAGSSSVWTLDSGGNYTSTSAYGPYGDWSAQGFAVGGDNQARLLWKNSSASSAVWTLGGGGYTSTSAFGPYGGWKAQALAVGGDNLTHLLWSDGAGDFSVWTIDGSGGVSSTPAYTPGGGWSAVAISAGQ